MLYVRPQHSFYDFVHLLNFGGIVAGSLIFSVFGTANYVLENIVLSSIVSFFDQKLKYFNTLFKFVLACETGKGKINCLFIFFANHSVISDKFITRFRLLLPVVHNYAWRIVRFSPSYISAIYRDDITLPVLFVANCRKTRDSEQTGFTS